MSGIIYNDGTYLESNPQWHAEDSPWKAAKILDILGKNNVTPTSVCEVGCGVGEILISMYDKMPSTVSFFGYDISPRCCW
jgi:ubiquinone/menaquinone biosynthesis C-methylase UbiE